MITRGIFDFIRVAKKLAQVIRWKGSFFEREYNIDRYESVAEHVAGMICTLVIIRPFLPKGFDFARAVELIVVHDLPEIITDDKCAVGDDGTMNSTHRTDPELRAAKDHAEEIAFAQLITVLGPEQRSRWNIMRKEYDSQESKESQVVRSLDRLDAILQILLFSKGKIPKSHGQTCLDDLLEIGSIPYLEALAELTKDKIVEYLE